MSKFLMKLIKQLKQAKINAGSRVRLQPRAEGAISIRAFGSVVVLVLLTFIVFAFDCGIRLSHDYYR